jgi:hypothetical protein
MDNKGNESKMQVLHSGIDTLEVSFQGFLPKQEIDKLEAAKLEAQNTGREIIVHLGRENSLPVKVAETGMKGGYKYRFHTGECGEIWFVKSSQDVSGWNLRVKVRAATLAQYGYERCRQMIYEKMETMGATVIKESIARVDYCMDFIDESFVLIPENFVCHSNSHLRGDAEKGDAITYAINGRQFSGITIGKMPGRQLIVYNKRREVMTKRKMYWWDIWGINPKEDKRKVWRLEIRAGKKHLKETWGITSWAELDEKLGDVLLHSLKKIRMVADHKENINITRCRNSRLWNEAEEVIKGGLADSINGQLPFRVIECTKRDAIEGFKQQICGMVTTYAYFHDIPVTNVPAIMEKIKHEYWHHAAHNKERVRTSYRRANERYYFLQEGGHNDRNQNVAYT